MRSKCEIPRATGTRPSAPSTLAAALSVVLAISVASCSTLNPQIFPHRLVPPRVNQTNPDGTTDPVATTALVTARKASGYVTLPDAIAEAEQVQAQYAQAISEQTQYRAWSDLGVITMTAAAVVTSLTGGSKHTIINAGAGAALTHTLNTTFVSVPRLKIYASGVTALGCAISSSEKFVLPDESLETPSGQQLGSASDSSLSGLVKRGEDLSRQMSKVTGRLAQTNYSVEEPEVVGKPKPEWCTSLVLPSCLPGSAGTPAAMKQCQDRRAALAGQCAGLSTKKVVLEPHPDTAAMIQKLDRQRVALKSQSDALSKQIVVFKAAGGELRRATLNIAMGVNDQVLSTIPDPSAVLSAAKGIKTTAFELTSASYFSPTAASAPSAASAVQTGKAQAAGKSGAKGESETNYRPRENVLLQEAEDLYRSADDYISLMHSKVEKLTQQQSLSRVPLESCGYQMGLALTMVPDVAEVSMEPGQSRTFTVNSPTGLAIQASTVPGLTRDPSGTFTYKASPTAAAGSVETLHFADSTGKLTRDVTIRIVKPAVAETTITSAVVDIGSMEAKKVAAALGLPETASANDIGTRVESCLKDKLSVATPARDKVPAILIPKIMNGDCRAA